METKMNRLNIHDTNSITDFCHRLNCSEKELFYCVAKVGTSYTSIECYLHMNRSLVDQWSQNARQFLMPKP